MKSPYFPLKRFMKLAFVSSLALETAIVLTTGCAHSQKTSIQAKAQTVRKEATAQNLEELGIAAAASGDTSRAEQYYAAAIAAGGEPRRLTERLIQACVADRRYPMAMSYAEEHLAHHPKDTEIRFALATIYEALGDHGKAMEALERVVREKPGLPDAHFALASTMRLQGVDPYIADEHFRTYLRLDPDGPHADAAKASLLKNVH